MNNNERNKILFYGKGQSKAIPKINNHHRKRDIRTQNSRWKPPNKVWTKCNTGVSLVMENEDYKQFLDTRRGKR